MKTVSELLNYKEREMQELQTELDALRLVARLLSESEEGVAAAPLPGANGKRTAGEHRFP
jgi:hypothetical protein